MCNPACEAEPPIPSTPPLSNASPLLTIPGTPPSRKLSASSPFTSMHFHRDLRMQVMADEMEGKFIGPMPVVQFLDTFLPTRDMEAMQYTEPREKSFVDVPKNTSERAMYEPLIAAMQPLCDNHLEIVDTHDHPDPDSRIFTPEMLKPDLACYRLNIGRRRKTDFSLMEFHVEVKYDTSDDAFQDLSEPLERDAKSSKDTRAQITSYAVAQLATQFRTHIFSILIIRNSARLLRWDRSGAIVTAAFDYCQRHLAEFIWRYKLASREDRGEDPSVSVPSDAERQLAREHLVIDLRAKLVKFAVYDDNSENCRTTYFIGGKPAFKGNASPTGRSTRTFIVLDLQSTRVVFLKDTWRIDSAEIQKEGDTYLDLHKANVSHIPPLIASGDVLRQQTRTQDFASESWARPIKKPLRSHRHYRLVLGEIGRDLRTFSSSWEMVHAMRDALQAHKEAYENAQILHRDISVGNILITNGGRGLLIDWDLSKPLHHSQGARQSERTGTWEFMSARLLRDNDRLPHTLADDLESFLHVLSWVALRFMPHDLDAPSLTDLLTDMFDHSYKSADGTQRGGRSKEGFLMIGEIPNKTAFKNGIVRKLLKDLTVTCAVRYEERPSEKAYDRYHKALAEGDEVSDLPAAQYDARMAALENSDWMLAKFTAAVSDRSRWPDEASHENELSRPPQQGVKRKSQFDSEYHEAEIPRQRLRSETIANFS